MDKQTVQNIVKYVIYGVVAITLIVLMSTTCSNYNKYKREVNNREALMDSIHTLQTANGELIEYRKAYELTSKEYSEYMSISDKERKDLEKKLKSSIAEIAILKGQVRVDTLYCTDSVYIKDGVTNINFGYNDQWVYLSGNTKLENSIAKTSIDSLVIPTPIKVGFTKDNNVFVTSENPYISFTTVEGAVSNYNKKTHKSIGLQVGVGPMAGYDPINKNFSLSFGVYVGVGFGYGLNW